MMHTYKKLSARILSIALSAAMVMGVLPATVFAAEDTAPVTGAVGTIQAFDALPEPFSPSVGQDAPDHIYTLSVDIGMPAEDLQLPAALDATVERAAAQDSGTAAAQESVAVTWQTANAYKPGENGQFIYTAVLPQGYLLADGVKLPQIYVAAGTQARAGDDKITIKVNDSDTTYSGATLMNALVAFNADPSLIVYKLTITAGEMTEDDWALLSRLEVMTHFEIKDAVSPVADIPAGSEHSHVFHGNVIVSVIVPQAIAIGERAFLEQRSLRNISFPKATSIGEYAFYDCSLLETATVSAVTSIGKYAFSKCDALKTVSLPRVTEIPEFAFYSCGKLTTLKLGATPPSVGTEAFNYGAPTRALGYVDADGNDLAGPALVKAIEAYELELGAMSGGKWNGWTIAADYTGAEAGKPSNVPATRTATSITLQPVTVAGETVEYACSLSNEAPKTGWQTSPAFTGLTENTPYFFFARVKASTTHKTGAASLSVRINTEVGSVPDYTGTEADAPSGVPAARTDTTVTLVPVTVTGETIEYTYSTSRTAPTTGWQTSAAFTGLTADTQYYFFARVKATAGHKAGKTSADTAIKTDKSEAQKIAAAKPLAETAITNLTATNATTANGMLSTVNTAIASITGVTATWKAGSPTITLATESAAGSIVGTLVLTCGSTSVEISVNKAIAQLGGDAEKVANAKAAAVAALSGYTATNATTEGDVMALVNKAITDAGLTGIAATWKTGSGFSKTNATTSETGSVTGTITLRLNSAEGDMEINLPIAKLSEKAALTVAIDTANNAKTGIAVSDRAASAVANGTRFVTTAEMKALTDAIAAAQAVADNPASTTEEMSAAVTALNNAVASFRAVIKIGTYVSSGGGGGGGSSGRTPAPSNTIDTAVGNKGATNVVASSIQKAVAQGTGAAITTRATFRNFDSLALDGLKTINEIVAKESAGKTVSFKVNFDAGSENQVTSRITVDPTALAKAVEGWNTTEALPLGVYYDQQKDAEVQVVNNLLNKYFSNKVVSVVYEQRSSLAVNAEFCAKLNLASTFGQDKQLYFYTYDNTKNIYHRIGAPNYWVDKGGYAHFTAPLGGSIVITDKPLAKK